jgi:D-alanyl-D-alanine carboxypeptidase
MNLRFSFFTLLLVASLVIVVFFCGGPASAMTSFESSTEEVAVSLLDPVVPWEFWDDIINQDGGNRVLFGIQLLGPSPYSRNSELNFIPASNTKLFTTAAALAILGPGYRYKTEIENLP